MSVTQKTFNKCYYVIIVVIVIKVNFPYGDFLLELCYK